MQNNLHNLKNEAISLIISSKDPKELEELRIRFLGRNGALTLAMKKIIELPPEEKPAIGKIANEVKKIIEETINDKLQKLQKSPKSENHKLDVTDPAIRPPLGHLHLVTQAIREITHIFEQIGFTRVRYPEMSWDWYNFTALNFPENHPARDDLETFYIDQTPNPQKGRVMLNVHTSAGQVQHMERVKPPFKMLNIAKVYRRQSDISHTPIFHQFETLVIGENISISHLKGVLDYFVKSYLGTNRKSRIRPYNFRFTEPSFETDVSCDICKGTGKIKNEKCRLCKEGWLEIGGAGMVHPNVLKSGGIDPDKYTGFASGWGVERVLMMKEGMQIDDLRLLYSNKLEFLEQF